MRWFWPLVLAVSCRSAPEVIPTPRSDLPEPYPAPSRESSGDRFGFVSGAETDRLEQALGQFRQKGASLRRQALRGDPMTPFARSNWDDLLRAIDRFLAQGVLPSSASVMIQARAVIESELEADASVFEQIPPDLVEAVLGRETRLGLRANRVRLAGEQRQERPEPPPRPPATAAPAEQPFERVLPGMRHLVWPVDPVVVNSLFGRRFHPFRRRYHEHSGLDLAARVGQNVHAVADGEVVAAGWSGGYGLQVTLDHGNSRTRYAHLSRVLVGRGERLRRGQVLGLAGQTGDATGPHLHFEYLVGGVASDPLDLLGMPPGEY